MSDHAVIDRWSLLMHAAIAQRVEAGDEAPLRIARENLSRWSAANGGLSRAQAEWLPWLDAARPALIALLRERSDNATRLGSSSPFACAISNALRLRLSDEARAA